MSFTVTLFPEDNKKALLSVTTEGKTIYLLFRRLSQYNRNITPFATEQLSVSICDGKIVGTVTAYNEQTGLVFVWDPVRNRILHAEDGEFAVRAILVNDQVYSLCHISCWGRYPEFRLYRMKFGNKDMQKMQERILLPKKAAKRRWPENGVVEIKSDGTRIFLDIGEDHFSIDC